MTSLTARTPRGARVSHLRDVQYMEWRYRNPLATYYSFVAGESELQGYLVAHRTRVDRTDGPTPSTIIECESLDHDIWLDMLQAARDLVPGNILLMWARDMSATRLNALQHLGFELDAPTGRLTKDWHLPSLLVRPVCALPESSPFRKLDDPCAWDMRAVCGRCWR